MSRRRSRDETVLEVLKMYKPKFHLMKLKNVTLINFSFQLFSLDMLKVQLQQKLENITTKIRSIFHANFANATRFPSLRSSWPRVSYRGQMVTSFHAADLDPVPLVLERGITNHRDYKRIEAASGYKLRILQGRVAPEVKSRLYENTEVRYNNALFHIKRPTQLMKD